MHRFGRFGLKLPIYAPFGEFLGHILPMWRHSSSRPAKGPSMGGNTSFEQFGVRINATVRRFDLGAWPRQNTGQQKSHKSVIFPLFALSPSCTESTQQLHVSDVHDAITCAKFQIEIFMVTIFQGSNFRFSYWFSNGPYNSAALMRCLISSQAAH